MRASPWAYVLKTHSSSSSCFFWLGNIVVRESVFMFEAHCYYFYIYFIITECFFFYNFPDTRVEGWFLLDNYVPTLVCSILYLLIVWLGPKYMKTRQPFSCRGILVVYNLGLTLLSLYMFFEVSQRLTRLPLASGCLGHCPESQAWVEKASDVVGEGRTGTGMRFEDVLKSIFQNTRVICTNVPSGISKIETFAIDSFVMYVLCYTQN